MYTLHFEPHGDHPPLDLLPAEGHFLDAAPLPHAALADYVAAEAQFTLKLRNVRIEGKNDPPHQTYTAQMRISMNAGEPLYGLVESGWVPFPFVGGEVVLVDRNVVSKIERLQMSPSKPDAGPVSPHMNLSFAGQVVHPLPYVLEGGFRKVQTIKELEASLARAMKTLRRVLPESQIPPVDAVRLQGLRGLLADKERFQKKASPFLMEICPSVAQPAGARQQAQVEQKILRLAKQSNLSTASFVVLAVLSCLYDHVDSDVHPKVLRPGRAVLKPKRNYSEGDAYAALSDLLFLEMLPQLQGHGLVSRPVFFTHDLGLAAFWSALAPRGFLKTHSSSVTVQASLNPALFPALSEDGCAELQRRIGM